MWTVIKFNKKNFAIMKKDFIKKLGKECVFYRPKFSIQKYKNNKFVNKEIDLLDDYVFCFHKELENPNTLNYLKFIKGLKYFLEGIAKSQKEISKFIEKCQSSENSDGYISQDFFDLNTNTKYKFSSGPFADIIFKIINLQKNKIKILMGDIKTTIKKNQYLFNPI